MASNPPPQLTIPTTSGDAEMAARWRSMLEGSEENVYLHRVRRIFGHLPHDPRCKLCLAPFGGPIGRIVGWLGYGRWDKNPQLCNPCMTEMARHNGGAEIETTILFADIRGSTSLAAGMSAADFKRYLDRFYRIASDVIPAYGGIVDKFVGDGVIALFITGFAGPRHAAQAVDAARELQRRARAADPIAPTGIPLGIGINTGPAYVGVLSGPQGVIDFSALGDTVNLTERLSGAAAAGEIVLSAAAARAAELPDAAGVPRRITPKGIDHEVDTVVVSDPGASRPAAP